MTEIEEAAIGWAVMQLVYRATALTDAERWDALAELFAEDAMFIRPSAPDQPIQGRAAILESLRARPARTARHVVSNVVVDIVSETEARATSTLTLFAGPSAEGIVRADPVIAIGSFEDDVRKIGDRWFFTRRGGSIALRYGA
jgi:hypothetical protein